MAYKIDRFKNTRWTEEQSKKKERHALESAKEKRINNVRYWCNLVVLRINKFAKTEGSLLVQTLRRAASTTLRPVSK